jgi:hypothetical protein
MPPDWTKFDFDNGLRLCITLSQKLKEQFGTIKSRLFGGLLTLASFLLLSFLIMWIRILSQQAGRINCSPAQQANTEDSRPSASRTHRVKEK